MVIEFRDVNQPASQHNLGKIYSTYTHTVGREIDHHSGEFKEPDIEF